MVGLDGVVFGAINRRYGHGAAGCGEVDVFRALTPRGACTAYQRVCNQGAVFVIDVAHAGFLGGGGGWAPEAFEEGIEGC